MRKLIFAICVLAMTACDQGGLKKLSNGYEYQIFDDVAGNAALAGQVVSIDYQMVNDKGEVLNDTYGAAQKPSILVPEKSSPILDKNPLTALAQKLSVGDSAMVRIPVDSIPGGGGVYAGALYVDHYLKVLTIEDEKDYRTRKQKEQEESRKASLLLAEEKKKMTDTFFNDYLTGKFANSTTKLESGLKVAMINEKNGIKAVPGDEVSVQYYGYLKDGSSFDNSFRAGRPFTFKVGQGMVIKGWDLGIPEVSEGSEAILDIPYDIAYGEAGNPPVIPAKSNLFFYIKVEKVIKK